MHDFIATCCYLINLPIKAKHWLNVYGNLMKLLWISHPHNVDSDAWKIIRKCARKMLFSFEMFNVFSYRCTSFLSRGPSCRQKLSDVSMLCQLLLNSDKSTRVKRAINFVLKKISFGFCRAGDEREMMHGWKFSTICQVVPFHAVINYPASHSWQFNML